MALFEKLSIIFFILISCGQKPQPVMFPVRGTDMVLLGIGREAVEGLANFTKPKRLEYRFEGADSGAPPPVISPSASMEIEYSFNADVNDIRPVLETEGNSWALPYYSQGLIMHYAVPVQRIENFNITLTGKNDNNISIKIHSIEFKERWFGFFNLREGVPPDNTARFFTSPFVTMTKHSGESGGSSAWEINPPEKYYVPAGFYSVISADLLPGKDAAFDAGEFHLNLFPTLGRLNIPAGLVSPGMRPLTLKGDRVDSFRQTYAKPPPFPEPIPADPGLVLTWPVGSWRDKRYEVFRWEQFPSLLIFDFADYAVQDRMLKRLAFFVEKKGFRGRLAPDSEIAELHGWNAHDYRAEDLTRFFQLARDLKFPLLAEERELERILLNAGIIIAVGDTALGSKLSAGSGGIISVSRESNANLRALFMAHEGFHGLFFIDEDFRNFTRARWRQLPAVAKRFIVSYFGYQQYDITDEYLLINEFMGHVLQQSVSQAVHYFGTALPARLETSWRQQDLPPKDEASNSWPVLAEAFTREAQAFSDYVASRWGLAAGRVSLVTVRKP
ncbi:MAG: hypothetical protein LBC52_03925 [Treponema sp.]|jgi:hypothetical protein|nr:hypothetical protein [Treponema sp.]